MTRSTRSRLSVIAYFLLIAAVLFVTYPVRQAGPQPALALDSTCPDMVKAALSVVKSQCLRTARNKACYGNTQIDAQPPPTVKSLKFAKPGDITDMKNIQVLKLGALDTASNTWGIALLRVQADLPGASVDDNITVLMFGDVQVTDAAKDATLEQPTAIAEYLTALPTRTPLPTAGVTPSATFKPGPTPRPTITPRPSATPRPLPTQPPYTYKPMQAFYFKTGTGDPPCAEAPPDGILIQTPQGKGRVQISIDGVFLQVGSTIFVQAPSGNELIISVLEGSVTAIARGVAVTAGTFERIHVPLDPTLHPAGPPALPDFYDNGAVPALPVSLMPLIVPILTAPPAGSTSAKWVLSLDPGQGSAASCNLPKSAINATFFTSPDGASLWMRPQVGTPLTLTRAGGTDYTVVAQSATTTSTWTFALSGPDSGAGTVMTVTRAGNCTVTQQVHLVKVDQFPITTPVSPTGPRAPSAPAAPGGSGGTPPPPPPGG